MTCDARVVRVPNRGRRVIAWSTLCLVLLWALTGRGAGPSVAAGEGLGFAVVDHAMPAEACGDRLLDVPISLHNIGHVSWSHAAGDRLSYHWLDAAGDSIVFEGERTFLPRDVPPGQRIELSARVRLPVAGGHYRLVWAMVREDVRWYPNPPARGSMADVVVGGPAFRWQLVRQALPTTMVAGEQAGAEVSVRNVGCEAWRPETSDRLSYRWYDGDGAIVEADALRTELPHEVAPGQTVALEAVVKAPWGLGSHRLEWEMVRDKVAWFGPPTAGVSLSPPIEVKEATLSWSLEAAAVPAAIRAGELVEVPVVIRNTGTTDWDPERGDGLSYHFIGDDGTVQEGLRSAFPYRVGPGESLELVARVRAPDERGPWWLVWRPVREHVQWFPDRGPRLPIAVTEPALAWELRDIAAPPELLAGRARLAWARIKNVGDEAWSPSMSDHVSYRWRDSNGNIVGQEGLRTRLPGIVPPGETVELLVRLRAPDVAGAHVLELGMVREHVAWMSAFHDIETKRVSVSVVSLARLLPIAFLLGSCGLLVSIRRRMDDVVARLGPALWSAIGTLVVSVAFFELSGIEPWERSDATVLACSAAIAVIVIAMPRRIRAKAAAFVTLAVVVLAWADLAYLRAFGTIVPLSAFAAAHQLVDVGASVFVLLEPRAWVLVPMVVAAMAMAFAWPIAAGGSRPPWLAVSVLAAVSIPGGATLLETATGHVGRKVYSEVDNVGRLGLIGAHALGVVRGVREWARGRPLPVDDREAVRTYASERAEQRRTSRQDGDPLAGVGRGRSVVLIQVEALQQWVVEAEVAGEPVMPFLAGWSGQGISFTNVFDETGPGVTSDAEYLVLASNYPLAHGALAFLRADDHFVTLAHRLAEQGYATLSAHPYERGFWNRAVLHPRYGFARSLFRRELGDGPVVGWGLADGTFFERMLPELRAIDQPFFAFLVTLSLHHPYESFPAELAELHLGELAGTPIGNYLQAMRYFDRSLEQFVSELARAMPPKSLVIAVYGDHDARLEPTTELARLAALDGWAPGSEAMIDRVPFFLSIPGTDAVGTMNVVGGHADIGPTLLHVLGIESPLSFLGRSLLSDGPGFATLADGGAVSQTRIYVARGRDIPREGGCFDLVGGATRPLVECDDIRRRAAEELRISRLILDHDLYRWLAGR